MHHVPGVKHSVADGLSRHPVDPAEKMTLPDDVASISKSPQSSEVHQPPDTLLTDIEGSVMTMAFSTFQASPITSVTWDLVCTATVSNTSFNALFELIESGAQFESCHLEKIK